MGRKLLWGSIELAAASRLSPGSTATVCHCPGAVCGGPSRRINGVGQVSPAHPIVLSSLSGKCAIKWRICMKVNMLQNVAETEQRV